MGHTEGPQRGSAFRALKRSKSRPKMVRGRCARTPKSAQPPPNCHLPHSRVRPTQPSIALGGGQAWDPGAAADECTLQVARSWVNRECTASGALVRTVIARVPIMNCQMMATSVLGGRVRPTTGSVNSGAPRASH